MSMKLILIISFIFNSVTLYPIQVIAQTKKPATIKQPTQPSRKPTSRQKSTSRPVFIPPKPPPGLTPVSGRRAGMGSRDNCPKVSIPLTALVPLRRKANLKEKIDTSTIGIVEGLTTLEKPKFLFYLPYTQDLPNSSAEFSLQDSEGMDVYRTPVELPSQPGIIDISLPNTVKSLQVGQNYRWYFKVRCKQGRGNLPVFVEGSVQRINLESRVRSELQAAADNRQKILVYTKEGIWFDALNLLAQISKSSPQDVSIKEDWQTLLKSVGLDRIATAPFLN